MQTRSQASRRSIRATSGSTQRSVFGSMFTNTSGHRARIPSSRGTPYSTAAEGERARWSGEVIARVRRLDLGDGQRLYFTAPVRLPIKAVIMERDHNPVAADMRVGLQVPAAGLHSRLERWKRVFRRALGRAAVGDHERRRRGDERMGGAGENRTGIHARGLADRPVPLRGDFPQSWSMPCIHDGFHSGEGRYERASGTLRYVLVCDTCHAEVREVLVQSYVPEFNADGNSPHRAA